MNEILETFRDLEYASTVICEIGEKIKNDFKEATTLNSSYIKTYKETVSYEKRCNDSNRVRVKYPEYIPVIIDYSLDFVFNGKKKSKFLIPINSNVPMLLYHIRKQLNLEATEAVFLFIDNMIANHTITIGEIYQQYLEKHKIKKDGDKYLYALLTKENTFG